MENRAKLIWICLVLIFNIHYRSTLYLLRRRDVSILWTLQWISIAILSKWFCISDDQQSYIDYSHLKFDIRSFRLFQLREWRMILKIKNYKYEFKRIITQYQNNLQPESDSIKLLDVKAKIFCFALKAHRI